MENPQQVDEIYVDCFQPSCAGVLQKNSEKNSNNSACSVPVVPAHHAQSRKQDEALDEPLKGSGSIIFKSMKDDPFCMMHTVQQSVIFQELDFSYITSRIAVMSYPGKVLESACGNRVEDVREYLDLRHPGHYAVYNVSGHAYLSTKFPAKIYEAGWPMRKAPPFKTLLSLCRSMYLYLRQDSKNVCVVHCLDGKSSSAVLVSAFLIFCKLFKQPEEAVKMFTARRCPVVMTPSQFRYIHYISYIVGNPPLLPHNNSVALHSISMRPVPLCNECDDQCRPFVEVYVGEECIFTSLQDYENTRYYNFNDKCIVIPISAIVKGDVTIVVYHAKSKMFANAQEKCAAFKIFQFQFHSGFLSSNTQTMILDRNELDYVEELDTYPGDFTVTLLFNSSYKKSSDMSPLIHKVAQLKVNPELLFNADEDLETFTSHFTDKENILESSKVTEFTQFLNLDEHCQDSAENIHVCYIDSESDVSVLGLDDFATEDDLFNMEFVPPLEEGDSPLVDLIGGAALPTDDANLLGSFQNLPMTKADMQSDPLLRKIPTGNSCHQTTDFFSQFQSKASSDSGTSEDDLSVLFTSSTFNKTCSSTQSTPSSMSGLSLSMSCFNVNSTGSDDVYCRDLHSPLPFCMNNRGTGGPKGQTVNTISRHVSAPNLKVLANGKSDPFADLGNIISSFGLPTKEQSKARAPFTEHISERASTPSRHFYRQQSAKSSYSEGTPQKPNNKRSHFSCVFNERNSRGAKKYSGVKPKLDGNEFEDLLGSQGYSGFQRNVDNEPKTMAKLQHMELSKEMDPERLKVLDWLNCKKHNIRALLCSLHTVLWEGTRWQEIGMHRLLSAGDVKRYYRKACLTVHPDKQMGTKNENLAKLIFMELKDAWSKFEKQPNLV